MAGVLGPVWRRCGVEIDRRCIPDGCKVDRLGVCAGYGRVPGVCVAYVCRGLTWVWAWRA